MSKKKRLYNDILRALSMVLDIDEGRKLYHAWRVGLLAFHLAKFMDIPSKDLIYPAGLLHDIGGIGLEDHLIHHASKGFTDPRARAHPQKGAAILKPFALFEPIVPIIGAHHEHYDGSGFPAGLKGDDIPIEASILLLADIIDIALRDNTVSEKQNLALRITKRESGRRVNPVVAEAALQLMAKTDTLIPSLFDDVALKTMVYTTNSDPLEIAEISHRDMLSQLLWVLARIIDTKRPLTMGHASRVTYYAQQIALAVGEGEIDRWDVIWAGLLHNIGIVAVPGTILQKLNIFNELNDREQMLRKRQSQETIAIINTISDLAYLAYPAAAHSEWYDGSGFPWGNAGEDIPLLSRILAFANTYDSLTNWEGAEKGMSHEAALERIKAGIGSQFDPHLAPIALEVLERFNDQNAPLVKGQADFSDLFQTDKADIAKLRTDPDSHFAPLIVADRGVILEDLNRWKALELSMTLHIVAGKNGFLHFTIDTPSDFFPDFLETDGKSEFKKAISNLQKGQPLARYFLSASRHPLEMIIIERKDRYDILYRSASYKLDPLKRMSLLYRNFLTSTEGAIFLDPAGHITDANQSFLTLYGYQLAEVTGQSPEMLKSKRQKASAYQEMWRCLSDKNTCSWSGEIINRKKNGEEVTVLLTISSLFDSTGTVMGYICQHHDITTRKKQEEALRKKDLELEQKNRELEKLNQLKSDLMAITSHDLKAPIFAMVGYADLLKSYLEQMPKEKLVYYLESIMEAGKNQLNLIDELLDLYKFESGLFVLQIKTIALDALLNRSVKLNAMTGKAKQVSIKLYVDGIPRGVPADETRMQQVFDNLLSNAVKFSPSNSQVTVHYREVNNKGVEITIDDQGPGISEADLKRVFDRYYQAKHKNGVSERLTGVGLGLYISKHIITLHGGTLRVENIPNGGCRFTLRVPLGRIRN